MEVMNNDIFSQNETLVGQAGKTRSMGVSDDPMLMSMLSTGFYANPLRTMIQEVMFNAWDAHKAANCENKPIDVYINETSGLIIRDYGFGISDEDMVPIYCIYGASTKRKDSNQTGGFGLGCKSPFAYTESFTVTSQHNGIKSMYLVSRVSDDTGGKPGLTPLVSTTTTESGLTVTIPINANDFTTAYKYISDILYLSGINVNLHYLDEKVEHFSSESILPNSYIMNNYNSRKTNNVYAVYGGVSYKIEEHEDYKNELDYIKTFSKNNTMYIGFAPNSLTPVPNRESINLNQRTRENIRSTLELCVERFNESLYPAINTYFKLRFEDYKKGNVQPHFALYHALGIASNSDNEFIETNIKKIRNLKPANADLEIWNIVLYIMVQKITKIKSLISDKKWVTLIANNFIKTYPEHAFLGYKILKRNINIKFPFYSVDRNNIDSLIASWVQPNQMKHLFQFEKEMSIKFPETEGFKKPDLRLKYKNKYIKVVRNKLNTKIKPRTLSKVKKDLNKNNPNKFKYVKTKKIYDNPDQIWDVNKSKPINQLFLNNTIIIAKTVSSLNDTCVNVLDYFSNDHRVMYNYKNNYHDEIFDIIPAYVINNRKGQFEEAYKILVNLGFTVIKADEPEKQKYTSKTKKVKSVKQYQRLNTFCDHWQHGEIETFHDDYDPKEDGIPLTDPTHYIYLTKTMVKNQNSYYSECPNKIIINQILKKFPDTAIAVNQTQADFFKEKGVKNLKEAITDHYNNIIKNKIRFRNIVRILKIQDNLDLLKFILQNENIKKILYISKIKNNDLDFFSDVLFIDTLIYDNSNILKSLRNSCSNLVDETFKKDSLKFKIHKTINALKFLDNYTLKNKWKKLSLLEQDKYSKAIVKFIKSIQ